MLCLPAKISGIVVAHDKNKEDLFNFVSQPDSDSVLQVYTGE